MPLEAAIARIKECYRTFSADVEVSVENGVATITLPDETESPDAAAVREHDKGAELANRGDFRRAIPLFQKAVNLSPGFVAARRDLAMSLLDAGEPNLALNHLIDVLRQDPSDAWAHVLVANIFVKSKRNLKAAETYYTSALAINPEDVYALSNYGALLTELGRMDDAKDVFERAIKGSPDYPNAYLGLAILHANQGRPRDSLSILENLFRQTKTADSRANTVYTEGRRLFVSLNQQLADSTFAEAMALVDEIRSKWATRLEIPIHVIEDPGLDLVDTICETAWNHRRDHHVIRYRVAPKEALPHLLAHEIEHLVIEDEAFRSGCARSFMLTEKTMTHATRTLQDFSLKLKKRVSDTHRAEMVRMTVTGQCRQLFNYPIDMFVERNLHEKYPLCGPPSSFRLSGRTRRT
jgi:Flp pilus assembly protein TadD